MSSANKFLVLIILLQLSCSPGRQTKIYLAKIDSLSLSLNNKANEYESLNTMQIQANCLKIEQQVVLLDSLVADSLNTNLTNYSAIWHSFVLFLEENPLLIEEISTAKKQLDDLKYDAENNLINKNQLKLYLDQEEEELQSLQHKIDLYHERILMLMNSFEILNPKIEQLIDSLSKK